MRWLFAINVLCSPLSLSFWGDKLRLQYGVCEWEMEFKILLSTPPPDVDYDSEDATNSGATTTSATATGFVHEERNE